MQIKSGMPENPSFIIRPMILNDLDQAFNLSKSEGWNQTEKDWRLLLDNPINTCLVAEHQNRVAGTATALNHSNEVAWIGMVLVDKSLRGQGAGKMLLMNIIDKLRLINSIKLDATPEGQPLYASLGFKEEYVILRMINSRLNKFDIKETDTEPVHPDEENLSEVLDLDRNFFGTDRSYLLGTLFHDYPERVYIQRRKKKLDGYIFGRAGIKFNYLGPVSAHSSGSAGILISTALKSLINQPVALDIPEDKRDLIRWLESIGFVKQRQFYRMYLKSNHYHGILKNQFLISGPEYG